VAESRIRHLASAHEAPVVAAGEFERVVSIWSVAERREVSRFDTVLSFGGRRLALSPAADLCIAAAYHVHGVVCYDAVTGGLVWSRRDLKKAQVLKVSRTSEQVFCGFDDRAFMALDLRSGVERARHRGVREIHESPHAPLRLVEKHNLEIRDGEWRKLAQIERRTFATLAAAFSPSHLAISESGGGVSFVRLSDFVVASSYTPPAGSHVLELAYSVDAQTFVGVEWPFAAGGPKRLLRIDCESGTAMSVAILGSPAKSVFLGNGAELLTSDGVLFSMISGEAIGALDFSIR
jgi:hypothetical protein